MFSWDFVSRRFLRTNGTPHTSQGIVRLQERQGTPPRRAQEHEQVFLQGVRAPAQDPAATKVNMKLDSSGKFNDARWPTMHLLLRR